MPDIIVDAAGQKGTGRWSAIESQQLGVPATVIEAAVAARSLSSMRDERKAAEPMFNKEDIEFRIPAGPWLNRDLELALFAAKIAAYAQGFDVMASASEEYGWNLPMPEIARIWRAGCIIRSQFLDEITKAFSEKPDVANLIVTPAFSAMVNECLPSLRRIVFIRYGCRPSGTGPRFGSDLFRCLSSGTRHRQPDPGTARLLRRSWFRPPRWPRYPPWPLGQRRGLIRLPVFP